MSVISVVAILFGIIVLIARGPLIIAPRATAAMYRKLIASPARVRVLGACVVGFGLAMALPDRGESQIEVQIIHGIGWIVAGLGGLLLVAFPGWYIRMAEPMLDALERSVALRLVGLVGIAIAWGIIYLGYAAR